jgi:peptidoglycan/LPS O-acetylase OafA/YrhL
MSVRQLDALTSLRFVAAFYVFVFHCITTFFGVDPSSPLYLGPSGVTFFFVLSGFILSHNYAGRDFRDASVLAGYVRSRIARIAPVYLLSLVAGLPFAYAKFLALAPTTLQWLYGSSFVFAPIAVHAWVPGAACALNCPSWSISVELFFYLLLPFILLYVMLRPLLWLLVGTITLIGSFIALQALWEWSGVSGTVMEPGATVEAQLLGQFVKYFPLWRLPEFLFGMAMYSLWTRKKGERLTGAMFAFSFCAALALYWLSDRLPGAGLHNGLSVVVWAPLIIAAANVNGGLLHHPALVFLGRVSFSLYLLHLPVLLAAKRIDARAEAAGIHMNEVLVVLVAGAAALVIAIGTFLYVEEPSRRLIMSRAK